MKKSKFVSLVAMVFTLVAVSMTILIDSAELFAVTVKQITVQEASQLIDSNSKSKSLVVLDVRTAEEFAEDHIKDAKQLDFYAKDFKDQLAKLDKSKHYLVYCRSGSRSAKATVIMSELGFAQISDIGGGMIAWEKARLPVVSGP